MKFLICTIGTYAITKHIAKSSKNWLLALRLNRSFSHALGYNGFKITTVRYDNSDA